jgi:dTDP-glucose pyrophosphorylase
MDAIIPAAGLATRMRGIPKFLLPCDDSYTTLIESHIEQLLQICETIWIPTRPEFVVLLNSIGLIEDRVVVLPMQTENMTQTVNRVLAISNSLHFQLIMPDTYFLGEKPYESLQNSPTMVDLACWSIRTNQLGKLGQVKIAANGVVEDMKDKDPTCVYQHSWGALTFARELMNYSNPSDPHIGYAVKAALNSGQVVTARIMAGKYFDCGTPSEYLDMLGEVLL